MTYLFARPALRRLKESQPTMYEVGLLDRLRAKVGEKSAGALQVSLRDVPQRRCSSAAQTRCRQ